MSREIRLRMVWKSRCGTATSAIWNVTYRAEQTTFAPILMSLPWRVVSVQWLTPGGRATRRRKFPRLYVSAKSWRRVWLSTKSWQESLVHLTAFLPSLIH